MTLTPTTSPNSNSTPPSFDSASQVKEDSVGPVIPRKNGSNRPRTTRSIFGKLNISMLNGSRQSIAEDAPNTAPCSRRYRRGAASHHHPHTDTGFAFVKTSGAQSRLWTADDVLELTAPPLIQGVFLRVICKATRVMTSDPTSVLADQGHETGPLPANRGLAEQFDRALSAVDLTRSYTAVLMVFSGRVGTTPASWRQGAHHSHDLRVRALFKTI
ncbi:hypothetical protein B0H14DRAFT_3488978 [Mycena olivaceomarginata]|nr:hypothetical protein B0H14DRAFT_3488978 [Mycena olivaceomarginata]